MPGKSAYYCSWLGDVWMGEGTLTPRRLEKQEPLAACRPDNIFVMGTRWQAGLVDRLLRSAGGARVYIGGPAICTDQGAGPEKQIYRMRETTLPAALGGFHPATAADVGTYGAVAAWCGNSRLSDAARIELLHNHPARGGLGFLDPVDWAAATRLLAWIVDPRWFIDKDHPDRNSRMRSYLGLSPAVVRADASGAAGDALVDRYRTVRDVWNLNGPATDGARDFLRRYCRDTNDGVAVLRTSQFFIDYLRHVWLDALIHTATGRSFQIFLPERCFLNDAPALAAFYDYHRRLHSSNA